MDIERVINDYRNGNEDKRMSLFLYYRELRDEFSSIDWDIAGDQSLTKTNPKEKASLAEHAKGAKFKKKFRFFSAISEPLRETFWPF